MNINYKSKKYYVGSKFKSTEGGIFEIIGKSNKKDWFFIKFLDENGFVTEKHRSNIVNGNIKNPFSKSIYGIGYLGVGKYNTSKNKKTIKIYRAWLGMMERCYCLETRKKYITYKDVEVSEKWHNFQNFAEWFVKNYVEGWALDKDLKQKGEKIKVYSEDTCIFIPRRLNNYIKSVRADNKLGISCIHYSSTDKLYVLKITDFDTGKEQKIKSSKNLNILLELRNKHFKIQNEKYQNYARELGFPEEIIKNIYKE